MTLLNCSDILEKLRSMCCHATDSLLCREFVVHDNAPPEFLSLSLYMEMALLFHDTISCGGEDKL